MRRSFIAAFSFASVWAHGATVARADPPRLAPAARIALEVGVETPELRALREWEERTFGRTDASTPDGPEITSTLDVTYLAGAALPDLPARWDDAVLRYLEYFRDDPRGRELMRAWVRRGHRYDAMIRENLRAEGMPEDLRCVALAESGFDPTARSPVGALGMWQFMSPTAHEFGLRRDAFVDERMDPVRSTRSAARYLGQLFRRFGTWELALAAYNMGYGSLLRAIRKYNTNDYATLARVEAGLPFETTVYVSKIIACGIVLRNPERFGLGDAERDPALDAATVRVAGGATLSSLAAKAGIAEEELTRLNPHLLRRIVPPTLEHYDLRVPAAVAPALTSALASAPADVRRERLRFGETVEDFARRNGLTPAEVRERNGYAATERIPAPITLAVPRDARGHAPASAAPPTVAVANDAPPPSGRRRVFYRVIEGDDLEGIATFFRVAVDELATANLLDARAALQPGMTLRIDAGADAPLDDAVVLQASAVRVVVSGSEAFFDWHERQRGRVRVRVRVQTGDTLGGIAVRYGLTLGDVARINRLSRSALLRAGQTLIVYTSEDLARTVGTPEAFEDASR